MSLESQVVATSEAEGVEQIDTEFVESRLWVRVLRLGRASPLFAIGLVLVLVSLFLAVFAPYIVPYNPVATSSDVLQSPNAQHWFGTDAAGLDVFSRVLAAARIDVTVAVAATVVSLVVGSLIGLFASFGGGRLGAAAMRVSDLMQAFPLFVLAIIIVTTAGRNIFVIVLVVALFNVPIYVRLMRTQVLELRDRSFVEAARASGGREIVIALRHVLPNGLTPAWAQASITLGGAILVTAGLSFIGAGIRPPKPEWGGMIASGANGIVIGQWWMSVFPGVAMSLTVFGFAAVGDGLRRLLVDR